MTPPDSDEEGTMRYRHVGKPDSGEREVLHSKCERSACTRIVASHGPVLLALWEGEQARDWLAFMVAHPGKPPVSLPLSLAQRILAALERDIWTELAAELREYLPKEPK